MLSFFYCKIIVNRDKTLIRRPFYDIIVILTYNKSGGFQYAI